MDIPMGTEVQCADGLCGQSTGVILNPTTEEITHLVVREKSSPHTERLAPVTLVVETASHLIRLRCTRDELAHSEPFIKTDFVEKDITRYYYIGGPSVIPEIESEWVPVRHHSIPPHELPVFRGAHVEATDGRVGWVHEFLIASETGHITHLVLQEGHLWGQKDVVIPVSDIDRIEENAIHLKLSKRDVEALPAIPVKERP